MAPDQHLDTRRRKIAPHIILGVDDQMTIMKEEIFGPFLPIKAYRDAAEVIQYVNDHHGLNGYKGPMWDAWQEGSLVWLKEFR